VAKVHQVILAAPLQSEEEREALPFLREFCETVITGNLSRQHPVAHLPGLFRFALEGKPLELKFVYSKELENKIKQLIRKEKLDIVQIEHSRMAFYVEAIDEGKHIVKVLDFHNIASIQYERIYPLVDQRDQKFRAWLFSQMMRSWEPHYANRFDRCITVSAADRQLLLKQNSALKVDLIPNGVDTTQYRQLPPNLALDVLMIGTMEYPPCSDMAIYFCQEILPLIRQSMPNVQVWIVGADVSIAILFMLREKSKRYCPFTRGVPCLWCHCGQAEGPD
jgi:glycosyltransferase involved in cell wall biosynthesis